MHACRRHAYSSVVEYLLLHSCVRGPDAMQALKRAEDSEAEGVRQRDALDAEWAALAAARAALQEDSQTVRAMGTLVQVCVGHSGSVSKAHVKRSI